MWSNKYLHIPFKEKGRSEDGVDCWGLVKVIYEKEIAANVPLYDGYEKTSDIKNVRQLISNAIASKDWQRVEVGEEQPYDVLVFRRMGNLAHVGVVSGNGWMIHCERGSDTTHVQYLKNKDWKACLEGIYRYTGNTDILPTV